MPYGDQAIFVRRSWLQANGSLKNWPLLEDLDLVQRLSTADSPVLVPDHVVTSGRRWEKLGFWKVMLLNQAVLLGYYAGVPPDQLATWYKQGQVKLGTTLAWFRRP